jgi:hypothetical protein
MRRQQRADYLVLSLQTYQEPSQRAPPSRVSEKECQNHRIVTPYPCSETIS